MIGFPGETQEQIVETFDFAKSLQADCCVFNIAAPLVGTEMYEQMLERGDIDDSFNWDYAFYRDRTFDTDEISASDIKSLLERGNIEINFFNNYALQNGEYELAINVFEQVLSRHSGHLVAQYCVGLAKSKMGDTEGWEKALSTCRAMLADKGLSTARMHVEQFPDLLPELVN